MPKPGEKHLVKLQPVHSHAYGSWQGTLGKGYGKGTVQTQDKGKVLITKASPTKIEFTLASKGTPERFILLKPEKWPEKDWLLINNSRRHVAPYEKIHYKKIDATDVEPFIDEMQEGSSVQAKLDGASSLIQVMQNGALEILSYRTSKSGRPIVHTERVFGGRPKVDPALAGTVLKGELFGERKPKTPGEAERAGAVPADTNISSETGEPAQRVIPPQELGGLLNATVEHSLGKQRARGIQLKNMLYDIQQRGKEHIDPEKVPYSERMQMLRGVLSKLPGDTFSVAEDVTDKEKAKQLWRDIVGRQHPLTHEGIVIHPATGKPIKAKQLEEADVYIRDIFPGKGRLAGRAAGGFGYSLEPGGPRMGEVGTGLSDELRRDLLARKEDFIGRRARIRSQEQHPSGAWRAPALIALHEG
jgi:hypothetical protein